SVMGASRALEELARLMPSQAHKITEEGTRDVPIEELEAGDKVLIKPGEKIPADGDVVEGSSSVNEAMLTGESKPVAKEDGHEVIGGSVNGEGSLTVQVKKTGKDSYLSQVVEMVRTARESKSRTQDFTNKAAMWLTIVAISAGALTLAGWLIFTGKEFSFSLERTVTVMVITCPHALGLAIPLVVAVSTSLSAKNGLLIRNRQAFERARKIDAVIFDKTGTLTRGVFGVSDVVSFGKMDEDELLSYAGSVETHSEHPIGRRIVEAADEVWDAEEFSSTTGKGVQAKVKGREVMVVSAGYLKEKGIDISNKELDKILEQGKTTAFVLIDDEPVGVIGLADEIRSESAEAIKKLKEMEIKPMMLTGDNQNVAKWVAEELGLAEYFAQVLPDQKAARVKEVQDRDLVVAMTGDGVNDAPALAQADIGIAIGAGTDVAAETADIILVKSNPRDVLAIVKLSKATWKKMVQNLIWATGYNVVAIPLAAGILFGLGILLNPAVGALLMSLSTMIVAINAVLLKIQR
ncbi:heavy metal translocating P-type ATPase, partial [candidate division WOR-3 bacterium]|nr:heavy metal translocating P-type ATPase [candidate division WOR-3 bacterium]